MPDIFTPFVFIFLQKGKGEVQQDNTPSSTIIASCGLYLLRGGLRMGFIRKKKKKGKHHHHAAEGTDWRREEGRERPERKNEREKISVRGC